MRTRLLLATAAATLAFAAPAAAAPFTDVGPFSGPAGQITLGGANSAAPAQIDWGLAGGVPNPSLQGRLFMDNVPGVQARVRVVNYDNAVNHNLLGTQNGAIRNGVAGLAVFGVNSPAFGGAAHQHVQIVVNGAVVATAICTMGDPTC